MLWLCRHGKYHISTIPKSNWSEIWDHMLSRCQCGDEDATNKGRTHGCLNKLLFFLFLYYFSFHHKQGISKRVIHHQLWFQARPIMEPRQVVLELFHSPALKCAQTSCPMKYVKLLNISSIQLMTTTPSHPLQHSSQNSEEPPLSIQLFHHLSISTAGGQTQTNIRNIRQSINEKAVRFISFWCTYAESGTWTDIIE